MFEVYNVNDTHRPEATKIQVYDIRCDKNGYPQFLIYRNGQWVYRSAKYFVPANQIHLRG